jgi:hypothetical protein
MRLGAQGGPPRAAIPIEPISAILNAFRSHQVVALGEGNHGNEQGHAFRLSLIRDSRFATLVNDIILEGANAGYQDQMDRFVRGEAISDEFLDQAWSNSTQPQTTFDTPIPVEFVRAVRAVNLSLAPKRRLRVWLGDPPIDWDQVHSSSDDQKWLAMRDTYPAELIRREVLSKQRHALVIFGDMHLQRQNLLANYESDGPAATIVSLLESGGATTVFSIWAATDAELSTLQSNVASWHAPSLALVRGTILGLADFNEYYPFTGTRMTVRDGTISPVPRAQWRSLKMEDQFDAVLYVGPKASITFAPHRLSSKLCRDPAYIATRLARIALVGLPASEADRLKKLCSTDAVK